jgi:rhamnosyltransferase subunit B
MGHLTQLVKVAEALAHQEHRFVFAPHRLEAMEALRIRERLPSAALEIRPAHHWEVVRDSPAARAPKCILADALKVYGYHEVPRLLAAARSWQAILREADPDLIVADFSPTLRLAAGDRCPFVVIGNGFAIPPAGRALPPVCPWESQLPPASIEAEAETTRTVLAVRRSLGLPPVAFLSDLFSGDRTFVCTIPEFDPYGAYRTGPTVDFFDAPMIESPRPLAERPENRAHVYLPGNHSALPVVFKALRDLGIGAGAYISNPHPNLIRQFSSPRIQFFRRPPPLVEVLQQCRLFIHHGGMLSTFTGLVTATPQLIMPRLVEHAVSAAGALKLGSVSVLGSAEQLAPDRISSMLRKSMGNLEQWPAAEACARQLAARPRKDPLVAILAACEELLTA